MRHLLDFAGQSRWRAILKFREVSGQPSYIYGVSQSRILHGSLVISIRHGAKEYCRTAAMLLCCTLQNIICLCIHAGETSAGLYYSYIFTAY